MRTPPPPHRDLVSPDVLPDNRVTFRVYAPRASEITIKDDWVSHRRGTDGLLQKDDQGVASVIQKIMQAHDAFAKDLFTGIIPTVQETYRVLNDREICAHFCRCCFNMR